MACWNAHAAPPFKGVSVQGLAENSPAITVEQMPPGDKIERWIGRTESTRIEHANQTLAIHQQIRWNEVSLAHHFVTEGWQVIHGSPDIAQACDIKEMVAF